jgi:hypothetical protein
MRPANEKRILPIHEFAGHPRILNSNYRKDKQRCYNGKKPGKQKLAGSMFKLILEVTYSNMKSDLQQHRG